MNKQQALQDVESTFQQKWNALCRMEEAVTDVTAAKAALEIEELKAIDSTEYQDLTNDKNRKAFVKHYCHEELLGLAVMQEGERDSRLQLSLIDNQIHMLALIAKINCEWSLEREPGYNPAEEPADSMPF